MARRGDELRDHMLWTAKDVFLELGFERASMDVVANRAKASKRSLYAHFGNKEKLYLAIVELVRSLLLERLGYPADHSDDPVDALATFCAQYVNALTVSGAIQMFRLNAAEAARFPAGAAQYYEIVFAEVQARVSGYIAERFGRTQADSVPAAEALIGQTLHPRLARAIFGIDPLHDDLGDAVASSLDLAPFRAAVRRSLGL